mmetsp:Transcript_24347/g.51000  ORF Transcript_24347/g.51000 Transcript_24347/m.51000 type:complete len:792 (+) Transcript_24347:521-2896(+)
MADNDNDNKSSTLVDLLGPKLIRNTMGGGNSEISVAELARTKKTIVLYFSAHWCPPCRGFTPILSESYAKYEEGDNNDGDDDGFELVFVSSDRDSGAFRKYHSKMSFLALPYESRDIKTKLSEKFNVGGIPHLVAVDVSTGEEDTSVTAAAGGDLRSFIVQHGAAAFPLIPSHIQKMKAEAEKKQGDALERLAASSIMVSVSPSLNAGHVSNAITSEENSPTIKFGELLERYEYIGLVFGDGDKADAAYGKIQEAAEFLNDDNKFITVYVGWTEYRGQSDHSALWERFHSIREEELTDETTRSTLNDIAGGNGDGLMMMTIKSKGSGLCGLDGRCDPNGTPVVVSVDKGLRLLSQFGPAACPWDEAAVKSALQIKARRVVNLKERLAGFDFLRSPSSANSSGSDSLLVRGTINDKEEGTEDERKHVTMDELLSTLEGGEDDSGVLGLYFSAHWCPPCRAFTPELLKEYEDIRTQRGAHSFEVVFVSFDNSDREFGEYYSSMMTPHTKEQWLSLEYSKSRELAKDLSEVFGLRGFPSLVLLNKDGIILSNNARSNVTKYGAGCFPWDIKSIQRGEEELLKKEEEDIESQRKQGGGTVVRRLLGPIGSVKYGADDRVLEFGNAFSTAVLDENVAKQGVLYYEVEILEKGSRYTIAQFGFALGNAFEKTNDDTGVGAGDNNKSWGVCGFRKELWHDGNSAPVHDPSSTFGWEVGDVIGFAVNVEEKNIAISKNGNWSKEAGCGVVFEKGVLMEAGGDGGGIHPALTSRGLKVRLNVQEKDFLFTNPTEEVWGAR